MKKFIVFIIAIVSLVMVQAQELKQIRSISFNGKTFPAYRIIGMSDRSIVSTFELENELQPFLQRNDLKARCIRNYVSYFVDSKNLPNKGEGSITSINTIIMNREYSKPVNNDLLIVETPLKYNLIQNYDDVFDITFYNNKYFTHEYNDNLVSLYIVEGNNETCLRLKMSYNSYEKLNLERIYLSANGNTKEVVFDTINDRKISTSINGYVSEWIDIIVNEEVLEYLKSICNENKMKVRYIGNTKKDRNLSDAEIAGIRDVLNAYNIITGKKMINKVSVDVKTIVQ